jgi:hypothetical protein
VALAVKGVLHLFNFLKIHKNLCWVLLLSLTFIIFIDFIYHDQVELFPGGAKFARIVANLSLSYVAGLIFYILTIYIPSLEQRRKVAPLAIKTTDKIIQKITQYFPKEYSSEKLLMNDFTANNDIFSDWLSNTSINANSQIGTMTVGTMFSYQQALEQVLVYGILEEIEKTSFFSKNLEPDFIAELYSIKRASICDYVSNYPASSFTWKTDDTMFHYESKLQDLLNRVSKLAKVTQKIYGGSYS